MAPIIVTGRYLRLDGSTPVVGSIELTPSAERVNVSTGAVLPVVPLRLALDATGAVVAGWPDQLTTPALVIASDDPAYAAPITYKYREMWEGGRTVAAIDIPAASPGGICDLASVINIGGTPAPGASYVLVSLFDTHVALSLADGAHGGVTGGPPSGAAGGVLAGNYPAPAFAVPMATQAALDAGLAGALRRFQDLDDVAPGPGFAAGQVPVWDNTQQKFVPGSAGGGSDSRLLGTGSLDLGTYAGTLPASGTLALLGAAQTFTALQTIARSDSGTTNQLPALVLGHNSSGAPAAGFGTALKFQAKSLSGADQDAAQMAAAWWDPSGGSRVSLLVAQPGGALSEAFRVGGLDSDQGFVNNVSDVARFVNLAGELQVRHHSQPSQGNDRWLLTVHPDPALGYADASLGVGYLFGLPALALAGMGISFDDLGATLNQASTHLTWLLPTGKYIEWYDNSDGVLLRWGASWGFLVAQDFGATALLQVRANQAMVAGQDLAFSSSYGPTVHDQSDGHTYRIISTGGVLGLQLVS